MRMTGLGATLLFLCAGTARAALPAGAELPPPPFGAHAVRLSPAVRPAAPRFAGNAAALRFRTAIREGARAGPNFADRFTVVTWGCGAGCQQHAIVDARTGAVFMMPGTTAQGVGFRRASRLLVLEAPERCLEAETVGPARSTWWRWTGTALKPAGGRRIVVPCGDAQA